MALFEYLKQTMRFLREQNMDFENTEDLTSYVNRARREIAMRAQCIRVLTPISGSIVSWKVTAGGTGYSASPTLTITGPDMPSGVLPNPLGAQATATANVVGGVIKAIYSQYGGSGYFQPQMTITDVSGTGATATPTLSWINTVNLGQEVYPFSGINLAANPGCQSVFHVRSVSIIYNNYRYTLPKYAFSVYQSMIRQYPFQYQYVPTFCSQFGQGVGGSFYMYPLPSEAYQVEWDCLCLPMDIQDDQGVEAMPAPWTDAVPYFAAHLAMLELGNWNGAKGYLELYDRQVLAYSHAARIGGVVNPYGRY
jgi:hypothetical protein